MKHSPKSRTWSPLRRSSGRFVPGSLVTLASLLVLKAGVTALWAQDPPRYALRRVYGDRPGPRTLIAAVPHADWRDFRESEMPNLHRLMGEGAVGLMPVAAPSDSDPNRTWVTLGAGRAAAGGPEVGSAQEVALRGLQADIASVFAANERARTGARAGLLGDRLHANGLTTGVIGGDERLGALVLMDSQGRVDRSASASVDGERTEVSGRSHVDLSEYREALPVMLEDCDVVLLDLSTVMRLARPVTRPQDESRTSPLREFPLAEMLREVDSVIGDALLALRGYDALVAVVCPQAPWYSNPVEQRGLGTVVLFETRKPDGGGLLYSTGTRWPGIITAADFAPTVLSWWQIPASATSREMSGHPLTVKSGSPKDLDRLARTLPERYRWGFAAAKLYVTYCVLVVLAGLVFSRWRVAWLPRLRAASLAIPLVPVGLLLGHAVGVENQYGWLFVSCLVSAAIALLAARLGRPALALAVAMLLGAAVLVVDTVIGAPLSRMASYTFPVMSGSRFYGLGNQYAGVLVGLSTVGLAALLQSAPDRRGLFVVLAAATVLVIGAPFWGANWGEAMSGAAALTLLWLIAVPRNWARAIPTAVGLVFLAAVTPAALDLLTPPSHRTHIGAAVMTMLSGDWGFLADVIHRKMQMNLRILSYTPWTGVVALVGGAALWLLLREGAPARLALRGQRQLAGGIAGAVIGGLVAMVVNDSGIIAGAGALAAAVGAVLLLAGSAIGGTS